MEIDILNSILTETVGQVFNSEILYGGSGKTLIIIIIIRSLIQKSYNKKHV
jgi:cellobiose-specific phosphotransferase system component IIC